MDVAKIAGAALLTAMFSLLMKAVKPEMSVAVSLSGAVLVALLVLQVSAPAISAVQGFLTDAGLKGEYMTVLVKASALSVLTELMCQLLRDTGENTMAMQMELCGRGAIVMLALPYMRLLAGQLLSSL